MEGFCFPLWNLCLTNPRWYDVYVKILTFNTGLMELSVGSLSFDFVPHVEERAVLLLDALLEADADVVCLQEIFRREDMELLRTLSGVYPHMYFSDHENPLKRSGLCILSKNSFSVEKVMKFKTVGFEKFVKKGAVKILLTEGPYSGTEIVNVHFPYGGFGSYSQTIPSTVRKREKNIRHMHKRIHSESSTVVVAGDFNFGPTISPQNMRSIKALGYEEISNGDITWDVENPLNRLFPASVSVVIDHIFINKKRDSEFSVIESKRIFDMPFETKNGPLFLSDHFGLLCEFEM